MLFGCPILFGAVLPKRVGPGAEPNHTMPLMPDVEPQLEKENALVDRAQQGDERAFTELVEPWRKPLFGYIYRMVTHRADAEDLLQDVLIRVLQNLPQFRREARFKSWLFGIATHICIDHLRKKKRWRVEAQLDGEKHAEADAATHDRIVATTSHPDFVFEIRQHIAACFSCVARTLEPEEQAALMLREVLGFSAEEAGKIMQLSEPTFRHRLSAARSTHRVLEHPRRIAQRREPMPARAAT